MTDRQPQHPVDAQFVDRWSPRAFDRSDMSDADLMTIFEAARWAPSSFNAQPWRLLYTVRSSDDWDRFVALLMPFNAAWAQNASALVYVLSDTLIETKPGEPSPSHTHSFDAGAAWAQMALQASLLGYHTHGMAGVQWDRARAELDVPDRFRFEAAFVIGRIAPAETLDERLRAREVPSDRKPIGEFAFAGQFPG